jgi:hypothetical protein
VSGKTFCAYLSTFGMATENGRLQFLTDLAAFVDAGATTVQYVKAPVAGGNNYDVAVVCGPASIVNK